MPQARKRFLRRCSAIIAASGAGIGIGRLDPRNALVSTVLSPFAAVLKTALPAHPLPRPRSSSDRRSALTANLILCPVQPRVEKTPDTVLRFPLPGIAQAPRPDLCKLTSHVYAGISSSVLAGQRCGDRKLGTVSKRNHGYRRLLFVGRFRRGGCASIALRKIRSICLYIFFLSFILVCG